MLDQARKKKFRSYAATLNYMSLNETDVQHAGKDVCAKMANPTQGKLEKAEESRQVRVESVRR